MLSTELVTLLVLPILLEVIPLALIGPREGGSPGPSGLVRSPAPFVCLSPGCVAPYTIESWMMQGGF